VQDVSRLVDVCRQSIVIERAEDLAGCLHTIAEDPYVEVQLIVYLFLHSVYNLPRQDSSYINLHFAFCTSFTLYFHSVIQEQT
jgi:hypothetical protein